MATPSNAGDTFVNDVKDSLSFKGARDAVSSAVDKAKNALGMSTPPPTPAAAAPKADTSWHDDSVEKANESFRKAAEADKAAAKKPAPKSTKALPKYKDGTDYVPTTGPAILHKGEAVLNKEDADKHRAAKVSTSSPASSHVSLHRALAHLQQGGLHRALGIPEGQSIPQDKLEKAKNSDNPHIAHMANFAATMEGWHHK